MSDTIEHERGKGFYLPDLMRLERRASKTGALEDCVAVWTTPFYAQRKYWFKIFIGFTYGLLADVLRHWTMHGIPDPAFNEGNVKLFGYLARNAGILSMEECLGKVSLKRASRRVVSQRYSRVIPDIPSPSRSSSRGAQHTSLLQSFRSRISSGSVDINARRASGHSDSDNVDAQSSEKDGLMDEPRQSKLSQEQLTELQRSTHFDKKELQQWYKGMKINLHEQVPY
jgi:hypothetical protein